MTGQRHHRRGEERLVDDRRQRDEDHDNGELAELGNADQTARPDADDEAEAAQDRLVEERPEYRAVTPVRPGPSRTEARVHERAGRDDGRVRRKLAHWAPVAMAPPHDVVAARGRHLSGAIALVTIGTGIVRT